jgi:hypothetical protein
LSSIGDGNSAGKPLLIGDAGFAAFAAFAIGKMDSGLAPFFKAH